MFTRDDILTRVIPHRLEAIATLNLVLRLLGGWDSPKPMKIFFADRLKITGSSSAFTNPVIEAGIIHCRALLEFLGLRVSPSDPRKLASRGASQTRPARCHWSLLSKQFHGTKVALLRPKQRWRAYCTPQTKALLI
jgi:hypothetical protein